MKVVLPEPDGPTRNTNSPLSISTEQSWRATVDPLYVLVTFWNLIMGSEGAGSRRRAVRGSGSCSARPDSVPVGIGELGQPL